VRRPPTATDGRDLPLGPAVVPHRKNAAEWVMWVVLWPVAWVMRRFGPGGGA
jgi:hypothetical protein